jgi:hypothetical protein
VTSPLRLGPRPLEAGVVLPPAAADADAAVPVLGAVVAADGEHAARRLGTVARPATPAIPPRTRRRVRIGLAGDDASTCFGVSEFAMVSSSDPSIVGRSSVPTDGDWDERDCGVVRNGMSILVQKKVFDLVDLWVDLTQSGRHIQPGSGRSLGMTSMPRSRSEVG